MAAPRLAAVDEKADEGPRHAEKDAGREHHDADPERERHGTGTIDGGRIPRSGGAADPNRGGLGDAERDHEGEGGDLQRDRMRGEARRVEMADQGCGGGEHADFQHDADRDRQAQAP